MTSSFAIVLRQCVARVNRWWSLAIVLNAGSQLSAVELHFLALLGGGPECIMHDAGSQLVLAAQVSVGRVGGWGCVALL